MKYNFPYLKDSSFLKNFDLIKLKEQFIKIVVLTYNEIPIQQIQGKVLSGSINIDGSSAMRRTANVSLIADEYENDLMDTKHLLSINKKIDLLIGFTNSASKYKDYPIIWFPQGTFVIISQNIMHDTNGVNISLTLHDKMALLNGECGGVLPASIIFNEIEDINEDGSTRITQPTIYQIIQELVNHFGGQQLGKIIISDINPRIKKIMKWTGSTPLYLYHRKNDNFNLLSTNYFQLKTKQTTDGGSITQYSYGEDVGYMLTDFVYPKQLMGNAGDTVVTILDQIKSLLGNYEYFYDLDGNFRFQEIKNYLNTSYSTFLINEINKDNYLVDYAGGKSFYTFETGEIIQSYSNSPQFQQIKNDFLIWGIRTSITGQEIPIRYHLTIDKKPEVKTDVEYKIFFYIDPDDGVTKIKKPLSFPSEADFPKKGENGQYYYAKQEDEIKKWSNEAQSYIITPYKLETITATDYRTQLFLEGVVSQPLGLDSNYYYTELKNQWPKIYDIKNHSFFNQVIKQPENIDYFLDFIDSQNAISQFNVQNIGRRTVTIVDDSINCIFESEIPNLVIIEANDSEGQTTQQLRNECIAQKQQYVQVKSEIFNMLLNGGVLKSAYNEIKKELYQYTNYNEQVSLTALPIYYLEPNTRITIKDAQSGVYGDYMIKSISLPLDINGTMSISCSRALENI